MSGVLPINVLYEMPSWGFVGARGVRETGAGKLRPHQLHVTVLAPEQGTRLAPARPPTQGCAGYNGSSSR